MATTSFPARYPGTCATCHGPIVENQMIERADRGYRHAACATGARPAPARKAARPRRERAAPPAGPVMRNDRAPYSKGDVITCQLTTAEIAECEARQAGVTATDVPDSAGKPPRAGRRRVAVVVIHTDRMSQDAADDNGYCGRYGCVVRLATAEEAAPLVGARAARADRAAAVKTLVDALTSRGAVAVSDTGRLPVEAEREVTVQLARGEDLFVQVIVLTADKIVGHHGGHYDDYRSVTYTIPRTEELAAIVRQLAA